MAQETTRGNLFFDLRLPDGLTKDEIENCKRMFEDELDRIDPFLAGDCKRNKWYDLPDVPTDTDKMRGYINKKLANKGPANLKVPDPGPGPVPSGTYCYPLGSRICYHGYALELNGKPWETYLPDAPDGLKLVIVLTYETPFVFSKRELDRANKKVKKLEKEVREAKVTGPTLRKTGSD